jgi:hypothetical protein
MDAVTSEGAHAAALASQVTVTGSPGVQIGEKSVQVNISLSSQAPSDLQVAAIADLLAERSYGRQVIERALEGAGLSPLDYRLDYPARLLWREITGDAARKGRLEALLANVSIADAALSGALERRLDSAAWYQCRDPYYCCFFGPGLKTAMIDRAELRRGLGDLAKDEYRVLVVCGARGSGKTHSWRLIEHLSQRGMPLAGHKCIRVTTHAWGSGTRVTSEMVAREVADLLDVNVEAMGGSELLQARTRKILTLLTARYPADGVLRWIILDGLDREEAIDADDAKDVALPLITKVADGELPDTRLVITGFDPLWLQTRRATAFEAIPPIGWDLVRAFLADTSAHLGRPVGPGELDALATTVLPAPASVHSGQASLPGVPPGLSGIEDAVVRLVRQEWGPGAPRAG